MKKFIKTVALLMASLMILTVFAGCGKDEVKTSSGESFTYWVPLDNSVKQSMSSLKEHYMYKQIEKITGVKVEFLHPSAGTTGKESFQILLASGDYPDMIEHWWNEYPGGGDQAIKDGVIISLNKYMEEYAPNYYNYMEGEAAKENGYMYKADTISFEGNYYGFKNLNVGVYRNFAGLYVRKDLLEKWGLDIPTTLDEWEEVLKTAKENGIKYPLTGKSTLLEPYGTNFFNTPYGVASSFYLEGDTVKFGPFEPEYKDYLKKMAEWMKKGYIDIDYVTNDTTIIQGNICNDISIAASGYAGGDLGKILPAMEERNPEFDLAACPFPSMKKGEAPVFQGIQSLAAEPTVVITTQCGKDDENRYKEAISWCDFLYSDEGMILKSFGVEGETFTREKDEDGNEHFVYTDKITNWENVPGATGLGNALYYYTFPANHPGFNQHPDYFAGYYSYPQQTEALDVWNKYIEEARKHVIPASLSYNGDEATEIANIESKGKDNLIAAASNIILGKASIDTYDDAIKAAKKAGYDRLIEITQAAYDRYKANMK